MSPDLARRGEVFSSRFLKNLRSFKLHLSQGGYTLSIGSAEGRNR